MASYQAKIGWKRPRRRENKNYPPFHSCPRRDRKFYKRGKKIQKIKKYHCGFILSQSRLQKVGKERK